MCVCVCLGNLRNVKRKAPSDASASIHLFSSFVTDSNGPVDVPDPYYGAGDGFQIVFDMLSSGMDALVTHVLADS